MFSILVVEDDKTLNRMICTKLKQAQYTVFPALDGEEALACLEHEHVDLIISDVMMPKMNGLELVSALRGAKMTLPVLMITALGQMEDMEKGFRAGTDDYMVKPINLKELLLRVGALLRRAQLLSEQKLNIRSTELDYTSLTVKTEGETVSLPPKEFYLLFKLFESAGQNFYPSGAAG